MRDPLTLISVQVWMRNSDEQYNVEENLDEIHTIRDSMEIL